MKYLVFGTSTNGNYSGPFGQTARNLYDFDSDVTSGVSGRAYAIPILSPAGKLLSVDEIKNNISIFKIFARLNKDKEFLVTDLIHSDYRPTWNDIRERMLVNLPSNCIRV